MRHFAEIAYKGTQFHGWQRQRNSRSVQEAIEEGLSMVLRQETPIMGCGRTDTGVHASQYFFHFDSDKIFPKNFIDRMNKVLGDNIAVKRIFPVKEDAHARFDAIKRTYEYYIGTTKNPFENDLVWYYPYPAQLDLQKMNKIAGLLRQYEDFLPFCKTKSDAKTMKCELSRAEWIYDKGKQQYVFHISADRFLRGMVRLIVGACVRYSRGKISFEDIQSAMEKQMPLKKSFSAPASGLFLTKVEY